MLKCSVVLGPKKKKKKIAQNQSVILGVNKEGVWKGPACPVSEVTS